MHITMVSAECAPVAKAGGLGDFVQGLSRELFARGHEVEIMLPKYDSLRLDAVQGMRRVLTGMQVPFFDRRIACDVEQGEVDGLRCLFIEPHSEHGFFQRGRIYGEADDVDRFAFFSRAVLEYIHHRGQHPDILHCNDWQTGLVPVLLYEVYAGLGMDRTRVCYSLHNLGHQGWTGPRALEMNRLDTGRLIVSDRLQDPGNPNGINLMKGGIVFSNFVTTVSPRYAWEVEHTEQGMGLQGVLKQHEHKFGGVLNGIDYNVWDPEIDPLIPSRYGPYCLPRKAAKQSALRGWLGLAETLKPIIAVVSRLDAQKGVELMRHGLYHALEHDCQFVLLGSALDIDVDTRFRHIAEQTAGSPDCHLELGYDEELAHLIYAGADMILIPSVYEPCGLTQMIAMKYGCVPIVRRVGGLADTVFDANYSDKPFEQRNGYVFDDLTYDGLESALDRGIGLWHRFPEYFRRLRLNGMRMDNSWHRPAAQYLDIYEHIRVRP